jgi:hypothetical protein
MRKIAIALFLAGFHWANPDPAVAQRSDSFAADSVVLTLPEKISVVNRILRYRHLLFRQPVSVDACDLAAAMASGSEDLRPRIDPAFRAQVHGTPPFSCVYPYGLKWKNPSRILLSFGRFRPEHGERLPDTRPPRVKRVIVVELSVMNPISEVSHHEEWVLQQFDGESLWVVVTLRVFGFLVS